MPLECTEGMGGGIGAGLMPLAQWLFGCNDIAAYKTNGANGQSGSNGVNGRNGANGRDGCMQLIDSGLA